MSGGTDDLGLDVALHFLGDRPDVPRLLAGLDALTRLSRGAGLPHVSAEAGAARLLVATRDTGAVEQLKDGVTGLAVPHELPVAVAAALGRLIEAPGLRRKIEREYSAAVAARYCEALFDEVVAERDGRRLG